MRFHVSNAPIAVESSSAEIEPSVEGEDRLHGLVGRFPASGSGDEVGHPPPEAVQRGSDGRDRTTASHACHRVEDLRDNPDFDRQLTHLENILREAAQFEVKAVHAPRPETLTGLAFEPHLDLAVVRHPLATVQLRDLPGNRRTHGAVGVAHAEHEVRAARQPMMKWTEANVS